MEEERQSGARHVSGALQVPITDELEIIDESGRTRESEAVIINQSRAELCPSIFDLFPFRDDKNLF
jgi:hypothetical protein